MANLNCSQLPRQVFLTVPTEPQTDISKYLLCIILILISKVRRIFSKLEKIKIVYRNYHDFLTICLLPSETCSVRRVERYENDWFLLERRWLGTVEAESRWKLGCPVVHTRHHVVHQCPAGWPDSRACGFHHDTSYKQLDTSSRYCAYSMLRALGCRS